MTEQDFALTAGAAASEATSELLRFAREGEHSASFAFDGEVVSQLAEALKIAIDLEAPRVPTDDPHDLEFAASLTELRAAVETYLEGNC